MASFPKGLPVTDWLLLLFGVLLTGASIAYVMTVPRRWIALPGILAPIGVAVAVRSLGVVSPWPVTTGAAAMAALLSGVGLSAGYWLASASLMLFARRVPDASQEKSAISGSAAIVLSFAAPERYRVSRTARHVQQLIESDALTIPTSALPFVFLSERARYRAVGDFLPARTSIAAVADQLEDRLSGSDFKRVLVAFTDGSPTLREGVDAALSAGAAMIVVVTLGPDGSLLARNAALELETTRDGEPERLPVVFAPSIWHSEDLAGRLVARILDTTLGALPEEVGVALVGEGQPAVWEDSDRGWRERENYFNQRVRLLLSEHGILEQNIRTAWLEWQSPDVTEVVRHLAAMGCNRIVIAPSTIPCVALSTALDLEHMVASARVAEGVRTVTLPPWGDDSSLSAAAAEAILKACSPE